MHILHSAMQPCDPSIEIVPPRNSPNGEHVFEPSISVWPVGKDNPERQGYHWSLVASPYMCSPGRIGPACSHRARQK